MFTSSHCVQQALGTLSSNHEVCHRVGMSLICVADPPHAPAELKPTALLNDVCGLMRGGVEAGCPGALAAPMAAGPHAGAGTGRAGDCAAGGAAVAAAGGHGSAAVADGKHHGGAALRVGDGWRVKLERTCDDGAAPYTREFDVRYAGDSRGYRLEPLFRIELQEGAAPKACTATLTPVRPDGEAATPLTATWTSGAPG